MSNIDIKYNGKYPNLCSGKLIVIIDDKTYKFPDYCLRSGGSVRFDENWSETVRQGKWEIREWPENFPEHLKEDVLYEINSQISHGCCGGCV
jgi:hypothetical protein